MYSGIAFMTAAVILAAAEHIAMIVVGRVLQGIAISFASVSVPIYNSGTAEILRSVFLHILPDFFACNAQFLKGPDSACIWTHIWADGT